jgi:hypothetical protein
MAGLTYDTFKTQLAELSVVPTTDPNFLLILPEAIEYAELRIQRDVDFLSTVVSDVSSTTSPGASTITIPPGSFVTLQNLNIITPAGAVVPDNGTRVPLLPTSKEFLQYCWPSGGNAGVPAYFAMVNDTTIAFGPWPDDAYTIEMLGTIRFETLSADNPATFISTYLPDLMLMAAMIYVSGYQRNFGRQSDDPQMAVSYESQYTALLTGVVKEEYRKKFAASAWTSQSSSPVATPTRG